MDHVHAFLDRLQGVKRRNDSEWMAICPAHRDVKPSLSVGVGAGEKIILHCHANCSTPDILAAMSLTMNDLFPDGKREDNSRKKIVATYDYTDEDGVLLYQAVRFEPKEFRQRRPDGVGGWIWNLSGTRKVLYHLPEFCAKPRELLGICEGEKDADNLRMIGVLATTNAMGAEKWLPEYSNQLVGMDVVIFHDNDDAGRNHADKVAQSLLWVAKRVRILTLPGLADKGDVSDWIQARRMAGKCTEEIRSELLELAELARDYTAEKTKKQMIDREIEVLGEKLQVKLRCDTDEDSIISELTYVGAILAGNDAMATFITSTKTQFQIDIPQDFVKKCPAWMASLDHEPEIEEMEQALMMLGVLPQWIVGKIPFLKRIAKADELAVCVSGMLIDAEDFKPNPKTFAELQQSIVRERSICTKAELTDTLRLMKQRGTVKMTTIDGASVWEMAI